MITKIIIFILIFSVQTAFGQKFFTLKYIVGAKDSYASILKKFVRIDAVINKHSPMIIKTKQENPHIASWEKLKVGAHIKLFINAEFLDKMKLELYKHELREKKKKREAEILKKRKSFSASVFYMASSGMFNQSNEKFLKIDFAQYSFITLGGAFLYFPKNKKYHFSSSIYISKLGTNTNNLNNDTISITPELGINGYFSYRFPKLSYSIYGGLDLETFSTFNLESIQMTQDFKMNESKVIYLTLGIDRTFNFFTHALYVKASLSKNITSSYTSGSEIYDPGIAYSGFKLMLYINKKINKQYFWHFLYKYHSMSGPDNLLVNRIGVGIGYIFK